MEAPPERREVLHAIRELCGELLPGYDERMGYGMPTYARDGVVEFAFASQRQYISLYGLKQEALDPLRPEFTSA